MAPDKIYVPTRMGLVAPLEVKESDTDVCYIRKDALLEWAKEREAETRDKAGMDDVACAYHDAIMDLIEKLNFM